MAVDVKIPLYIKARFDDVLDNKLLQYGEKKFKDWVITNAKFTFDAIGYGNCQGM